MGAAGSGLNDTQGNAPRETLSRTLPNATVASPVPTVVVVFGTQRALQPYAPLYQGKPTEVGGYFIPGEDANYVALALEGGQHAYPIIFHEFAHSLIDSTIAGVPVWLNEGLAEYYSTFETRDAGRSAVVGLADASHVLSLRSETLLPLPELLKVTHASPAYNEGSKRGMFYAQSWALVHYLIRGAPHRRGQLGT